jgi:hypothetical protein
MGSSLPRQPTRLEQLAELAAMPADECASCFGS